MKWLRRLLAYFCRETTAPCQGPCGLCGKPVRHVYPWWTKNPSRPDAKPLHDGCHQMYLFGD